MKTTASAAPPQVDLEYAAYVGRITARIAAQAAPLFLTTGPDLFEVYLAGFPEEQRQYHTCSACRSFLHRYGGLATVGDDGTIESALFAVEDAPPLYRPSIERVMSAVRRSRLEGVFCSSQVVLGTPESNGWHHLSARNPFPWTQKAKAAHEAAAEKLQDLQQIQRALADFPLPLLQQVVDLLERDAVYRAEKVLGQATFLRDLQVINTTSRPGDARRNLVFRAVALAPAGFCHPRTSMIGTLLDDLLAGLSFDQAAAKFQAKMHPLQYQRPQAAPKAGQVEAAEKLVEKLGVAESLKRRFARLEDISAAVWRQAPAAPPAAGGGVFSHLKPAAPGSSPLSSTHATSISWRKLEPEFARAVRVEILVPVHGHFYGLLTAAVPDSPPILQWDRLEQRNQVSWYLYHHGSTARHWQLASGWTDVAAVAYLPSAWHQPMAHHDDERIMFVLPAAKDIAHAGSSLFPETLRSELHGIRATIEAFSRTTNASGADEASANGLMFAAGAPVSLRVTLASGAIVAYTLDRWE